MLVSSMIDPGTPLVAPSPSATTADAELIERYRRDGDIAAITDVFLRHGDTAWRVARRLAGSAAEADDVLHDAYVAVLRSARRYRGEGSPRAWLLAAVVNTHRRRARTERRRQRRERESPPRHDEPRDDRIDTVRRALERLPERFRLPVMLRYVDGLPFPDIAAAVRCGERTARSRVRRGLERLRRHLGAGATTWSAIPALARTETTDPIARERIRTIAREAAAAKVGAVAAGVPLAAEIVAVALVATAVAVVVSVKHRVPPPAAVAQDDAPAPIDPLTAALAQPIRVRLLHDTLPEAMLQVASSLPRGTSLPFACPGAYTGWNYGGWPRPYFPWSGVLLDRDAAVPTRAVIDEVARQLGLRWSAVGGRVVFSRPLGAEEKAGYAAAVADGSLFAGDDDGRLRRNGLIARAASDADLVRAVAGDPGRQAERAALGRHFAGEAASSWSFAPVFGFPVPAATGDPLDALLAPEADDGAAAMRSTIIAVVERHRAEDVARCAAAAGDAAHRWLRERALSTLAAWDDATAMATVLAELRRSGDGIEKSSLRAFAPWPGRIGSQVAAILVRAAHEDESPAVRCFALAALAGCRDRAVVAELIAWFEAERDQDRRLEIAGALGRCREPSAEQALVSAASAAVGELRWRLVACLDGIRSPEILAFLLGTAASDSDGDARGAALHALSGIGGDLDADALAVVHQAWVRGLGDAHPHARGEALVALADASGEASDLAPRFAELLAHDPDPFVRANAVYALYGCDDRVLATDAGIAALASDGDARVRLRALSLIDLHRDDGFAAVARTAASDAEVEVRARACVRLGDSAVDGGGAFVAGGAERERAVRDLLRSRASEDADELVRKVCGAMLAPDGKLQPCWPLDGEWNYEGCWSLDWEAPSPSRPRLPPGKG